MRNAASANEAAAARLAAGRRHAADIGAAGQFESGASRSSATRSWTGRGAGASSTGRRFGGSAGRAASDPSRNWCEVVRASAAREWARAHPEPPRRRDDGDRASVAGVGCAGAPDSRVTTGFVDSQSDVGAGSDSRGSDSLYRKRASWPCRGRRGFRGPSAAGPKRVDGRRESLGRRGQEQGQKRAELLGSRVPARSSADGPSSDGRRPVRSSTGSRRANRRRRSRRRSALARLRGDVGERFRPVSRRPPSEGGLPPRAKPADADGRVMRDRNENGPEQAVMTQMGAVEVRCACSSAGGDPLGD